MGRRNAGLPPVKLQLSRPADRGVIAGGSFEPIDPASLTAAGAQDEMGLTVSLDAS